VTLREYRLRQERDRKAPPLTVVGVLVGKRVGGGGGTTTSSLEPPSPSAQAAEDYRRMIYAETATRVEDARKRFVQKWTLQCPAVVECVDEAGDELFTFLRFPRAQWRALRTTNALERINEEFRRRTKTQASLPSQDAVLLLLFGLLRSGQIRLRAIDGWQEMRAVKEAA
jgi:transposase-like protein